MVVCHCHALNDRAIVEEILAGAVDADTVGARCGAGTRCGGCRPMVEALVAQHVTVRTSVAA
jgi:bacterioferritin-associated ferredoxin